MSLYRQLRRLCPSLVESDRQECQRLCSNTQGSYLEDICTSFLASTTPRLTTLSTSLTSLAGTVASTADCVPGRGNNGSLDSLGSSFCQNVTEAIVTSGQHVGDGVTIQDCGPSCWPAPFGMVLTVLIAVLMSVCIVVTTFGNLLVIVSFAVDRQIRQPTNYFICSLAVTDVLIGTVSMPFYTVRLDIKNIYII